jgi:hypothetical protein
MTLPPAAESFLPLFRRYVPDVTNPDPQGWARGTCPYCNHPGAFWGNVHTGRWLCLPEPTQKPPHLSAIVEPDEEAEERNKQ